MTVYAHPEVEKTVPFKMLEMLVKQIQETPLPRVRESAIRHLYDACVTLDQIAGAYERDLQAGDRILNQMPDEEQNAAEETGQWLEWLTAYETIHRELRLISDVISKATDRREAA